MFKDIYRWFTVPVEEKGPAREMLEIIILYLALALVVVWHEEIALRFVLFSFIFLTVAVWKSGRELLKIALLAGIIVFGIVRPFVVQAFFIPSRSMENTLQVDDHIFVNRFIYRVTDPERWEIVVFEYPRDRSKDYIKRAVGLPGDTVKLKDHQLIINGEPVARHHVGNEVEINFFPDPKGIQLATEPGALRFDADGLVFNNQELLGGDSPSDPLRITAQVVRLVEEASSHRIKEVQQDDLRRENELSLEYGPVSIPEPGETVDLTQLNSFEQSAFINYLRFRKERQVSLRNGIIYENGRPLKKLKIEEELYLVFGDNRDHSEDSRVWGFVPESYLLGRAFFIYWPLPRIGFIES
ncbi:MAG: signal peptidase I [bacterium]